MQLDNNSNKVKNINSKTSVLNKKFKNWSQSLAG